MPNHYLTAVKRGPVSSYFHMSDTLKDEVTVPISSDVLFNHKPPLKRRTVGSNFHMRGTLKE